MALTAEMYQFTAWAAKSSEMNSIFWRRMNRSRCLNGYTRYDADCLSFQKPMTRDLRELGLVEEASVDSP